MADRLPWRSATNGRKSVTATYITSIDAIKRDVGASCIEIEYALLDEKNSLDRHPRYLLGNECGLRFDWGLDVCDDNSTNHVEWVGRAALKPLLKRFL